MNFKSLDSLDSVKRVIDEAAVALKQPQRTISDSPISDVLAGAVGAGAGGAIGFAALFYGGVAGMSAAGLTSGLAAAGSLVGGGMAAGVGVLAAPAVVLAGTAIYFTRKSKAKKLVQEKEALYKSALQKHQAIINELKKSANLSKEREEYLRSLVTLLQSAINDLKADLGK